MQEESKLGIVIVGHVDHGKSTLIGRLLYDTGSLMDGKYEEIKAVCERRGVAFEWSFLLDAFQAERDQAVTIDTTQIWFKTKTRPCVIIDAPGHREFLKNMVSGASFADAAVLVVDAKEGVREQTKRHAYLLRLLGLKQVAVAVNKMDAEHYAQARFETVAGEVRAYLADIGITPAAIVPISARHGENVAAPSPNMPWYKGRALLDEIDAFAPAAPAVDKPLRFPVQDVYRFDERRILAGRILSGVVRAGDTLVFSPSNREATVVSVEKWNAPASREAQAGDSIGLTLDQPIYVARGDVASHVQTAPMLAHVFRASVFWLGKKPLRAGETYKIKLATHEASVTVQSVDRVIDTGDLSGTAQDSVRTNDMAEVTFRSRDLLALDPYADNPRLGRCVIVDGYDIVGGGLIDMTGLQDVRRSLFARQDNLYAVDHLLDTHARAARNGHRGAVVWLTGLSGAGKSTLAMRVENILFGRGLQTYVLDGDNVRRGLCADLGFSAQARMENIRRVGEVAALMADAGLIALTAFISPFQADRRRAREAALAAGAGFFEIYVKADVATCEKRDPKGLYKKARAGKITDFTGVSSPYEPPETPELTVDTSVHGIDDCVGMIVDFILAHAGVQGVHTKEKAQA